MQGSEGMTRFVKSIQWGQEKIKQIKIYPSLSSTNDVAKTLIRDGCQTGIVLWALEQTAGRGRQGRSWESDQASLTFSLIWQVSNQTNLGILPLAIGLGLVQSLSRLVPELKVKWPNDLWLGNRKIAGILGETLRYGQHTWAILGVGLNVNQSLTDTLPQRTSLQEATGRSWSRLGILHLCLQGMEQGLAMAEDPQIELTPLFETYSNFLGQKITIIQGSNSFAATALKVLADGRLLVEDAQGVRALLPDEISLRFS